MSIVRAYEVIERVIVSEMIDILRYDGEESLQEWADKRDERMHELNVFVISTLGYNNRRIVNGIEESFTEAEDLITEFIREQWELNNTLETEEMKEQSIDFLNRNIQHGLVSTFPYTGTVERKYKTIIERVLEDEPEIIEDWINEILIEELSSGLDSGFIQKDGVQWKLDRYINEVEKQIYLNVYWQSLHTTLEKSDVELVKVFEYAKPRPACVKLQNSGIICIVPRDTASQSSLQYPNIFDPEHKYLEHGGHHGADGNCRHVWHNAGATEEHTKDLFDATDNNLLNLGVKRLQFKRMVERLVVQ